QSGSSAMRLCARAPSSAAGLSGAMSWCFLRISTSDVAMGTCLLGAATGPETPGPRGGPITRCLAQKSRVILCGYLTQGGVRAASRRASITLRSDDGVLDGAVVPIETDHLDHVLLRLLVGRNPSVADDRRLAGVVARDREVEVAVEHVREH